MNREVDTVINRWIGTVVIDQGSNSVISQKIGIAINRGIGTVTSQGVAIVTSPEIDPAISPSRVETIGLNITSVFVSSQAIGVEVHSAKVAVMRQIQKTGEPSCAR